jgi:Zn-dependent protease with chaperone function
MSASDSEPVRISFPDISPRAWEHPTDRAALAALGRVKGFDLLLRQIFGAIPERRLRLLYLANALRVGPAQLPKVHELLVDVCGCLDLDPVPELYLVNDPRVNAMAIGMDAPFMVVNSSLLQLLDDEELRCVLAHETAHVLSGHALYKTMLEVLQVMVRWLLRGPLIVPSLPVLLALKEWDRKSELSADRGSLLVAQDIALVQRVMVKLAGGSGRESFSIEEFERQSDEYRQSGGFVDKLFKVLNLLEMSHPFPVQRVGELARWNGSDEHQRILDGDYPRRSEADEREDLRVRVADAARQYAEESEDQGSLAGLARSIGELGRDAWTSIFGQEPERAREADENI